MAKVLTYGEKWPTYRDQWDAMKINSDRVPAFEKFANFAIKNNEIYKRIEAATGVPRPMIASIHWRESGGDFDTHLANGQPLNQRTTIAPVGLGPYTGPDAFFNGAVAALKHEGFDRVVDFGIVEKILYYEEAYNGRGYEFRGLASAYIWGGTSMQEPGKFGGYVNGEFVDNHFFPNVMDGQLGCAGMLKTLMRLDPTIKLIRESETLGKVDPPVIIEPRPIDIIDPPVVPPKPVVPPTEVIPEMQDLLDRRAAIAAEIAKLKEEDSEIDVAIKIIQRYHKK